MKNTQQWSSYRWMWLRRRFLISTLYIGGSLKDLELQRQLSLKNRWMLINANFKLDQVYCAWLIKWWIISGTWWYWVSIWRYWLVLGQYKLVLLGIRWCMVSKGLVCLYILEKVEIWSGDTDASLTDWQTIEDSATQLLYSIQFKLSHAISG